MTKSRLSRPKLKFRFEEAWTFPYAVEEWVKDHIEGYSLHVCCGKCELGDIKVDIQAQFKDGFIQADMLHLPIKPQSFDTVICDGPWHLGVDKRPRLVYQLRDCLKPNGILIFNAYHFPKIKHLKREKIIYCEPKNPWVNGGFIAIYRKIQEQFFQ
ncbi:MAG: class I SAM-dependent methyltransferase [Thermodesulfobacteriota bacterium]